VDRQSCERLGEGEVVTDRKCKRCGKTKDLKDFPVRATVCRTCTNKKRRARYASGDPAVRRKCRKKKPPTKKQRKKMRWDFSDVT